MKRVVKVNKGESRPYYDRTLTSMRCTGKEEGEKEEKERRGKREEEKEEEKLYDGKTSNIPRKTLPSSHPFFPPPLVLSSPLLSSFLPSLSPSFLTPSLISSRLLLSLEERRRCLVLTLCRPPTPISF